MGDEQGRHPRLVHSQCQPEAGHPRLRDLEGGLTDPVAVADADLVIGQPLDGEVLAELTEREVVTAELVLPVAVGVDLVDVHRAMLTAVCAPVCLIVAVDVDPAHHPRIRDRRLPDRRAHDLPSHGTSRDPPTLSDTSRPSARSQGRVHAASAVSP